MGREDQKGVEPSTGLVNTLRDKVGRELFIKVLRVFERIMLLGVGHRTRFEPAVKHFFDATQNTATSL